MNDSECLECCPPESETTPLPTSGPEIDSQVATAAKALAHPVRVRILRILLERSACTCGEIVEELPLAQATVSQHLKVLRDAGLIRGEIEGVRACYCANPHALHRLNAMLEAL